MIQLTPYMRGFERFCSNPRLFSFSTTRQGGVGVGAYASFNITPYTGDNDCAVEANRARLCDYLQIPTSHLILPYQTHGCSVLAIDSDFLSASEETRTQQLQGVDALVTDQRGVCIGVSTADCIPIVLHDTNNHVIAAIHAGWRGTVNRIVEKTIMFMQDVYHCTPSCMEAAIGPSISLEAFEVGEEVYQAFAEANFDMSSISRWYEEKQKYHLNLPKANFLQLQTMGIPEQSIEMSDICTYTSYADFFSARRLGIRSGRIFTGILMR